MGKQVLIQVAEKLGFKDVETLEKNVLHMWKAMEVADPKELEELRRYVSSLQVGG